jgi:CheY-like chemotaxis protein
MSVSGEPLVILFVEDDDDHAEIALRSLAHHGVANVVRRATDGEEALDYLNRRGKFSDPATSPRPHVVLLDLRLPKRDGLDVLRFVKSDERFRRIPVVVLTTSAQESDIQRAYDFNANAYLVKPVEYPKFSELMRDLGFFWLVWNQAPEPRSA